MSSVSSCCLQNPQTLCSLCMPSMVDSLAVSQGAPSRSPNIPCSSLPRRHSCSLSLSTAPTP